MSNPQVTIAGSYRKQFARIMSTAQEFRDLGAVVRRPATDKVLDTGADIVRLEGDPADEIDIERAMIDALVDSDMIYIVNPGGYVGTSAGAHAAYAAGLGLCVVFSEPPYERAMRAFYDGVAQPEQSLELLRRHQIRRGEEPA